MTEKEAPPSPHLEAPPTRTSMLTTCLSWKTILQTSMQQSSIDSQTFALSKKLETNRKHRSIKNSLHLLIITTKSHALQCQDARSRGLHLSLTQTKFIKVNRPLTTSIGVESIRILIRSKLLCLSKLTLRHIEGHPSRTTRWISSLALSPTSRTNSRLNSRREGNQCKPQPRVSRTQSR